MFCYNRPDFHPFIKDEEKVYLQEQLGQASISAKNDRRQQHRQRRRRPKTPWRQILTSVPFIALIFCQVSHFLCMHPIHLISLSVSPLCSVSLIAFIFLVNLCCLPLVVRWEAEGRPPIINNRRTSYRLYYYIFRLRLSLFHHSFPFVHSREAGFHASNAICFLCSKKNPTSSALERGSVSAFNTTVATHGAREQVFSFR